MATGTYRRLVCGHCAAAFELAAGGNWRKYCGAKCNAEAVKTRNRERYAAGLKSRPDGACTVTGCAGRQRALGLCGSHYGKQRRLGMPRCAAVGCLSVVQSLHVELCHRHLALFKARGDTATPPRQCDHCSKEFFSTNGWKKYCSPRCNSRAQDRKQRELAKRLRGSYQKTCAECGRRFEHTWRSIVMYCGKECKYKAWLKKQPEYADVQARQATRESAASLRSLAQAIGRLARFRVRENLRLRQDEERKRIDALRGRPCPTCGNKFDNSRFRTVQVYCSKACRPVTDAQRESRKRARKLGKMRRRGVEAERFGDIEILERDGWRCQICGVRTPRKLRGSFKPNAPEVDHIVPVSKGGPHVRSNVQCACRECNGKKSNLVAIGQMGLFTSLTG